MRCETHLRNVTDVLQVAYATVQDTFSLSDLSGLNYTGGKANKKH